MKNRIWKKLSAYGLALFLAGMLPEMAGACGTVAYAAETCFAEVEQKTETETAENLWTEEYLTEDVAEISDERLEEDDGELEEEAPEEARTESVPEVEETVQLQETSEAISRVTEGESDGEISDGRQESEDTKKKADLSLHVTTDDETVKAGSVLVYTVELENTGDLMLEELQLYYSLAEKGISAAWSETDAEQTDTAENCMKIASLDAGMKKTYYLTCTLPEDLSESFTTEFTVEAKSEGQDGIEEKLQRKTSLSTGIIPLKAAFEVTKTADRTVAVPGDKIVFQICIRNTGERTLHSVITTERFQLGNIQVRFLEKEGVVLNNTRTKARIEKIDPGSAVGLLAEVTLPENIREQELLNEVTVTTLETGEEVTVSQAKIQVKAAEEMEKTEKNTDEGSVDAEGGAVVQKGESYPVSTHPKTGDPYQPFLWLAMIPGSLLAAGWIRCRM
ncbi:COG1470 family protein [Blautia sp. MSJ-19]|uniref:COG1470 family protein n=1 Tax=Blautia sp. MSJ-19 TaxID=2841517 RepID=UPI001C0EF339|nr:DUF11 domain-containing protein [Blautia sp. MSJ-19]MBU5480396.1 hypothetical protein [Blautia sp. MSJ-19]